MAIAVGLAFEVAATMVGTVGKQLVAYSARGEKTPERRRLLKVSGLVATTLVGPVLDMAAYALAPQSIVAPLNGLDIVWNTITAPYTLGEHLTNRHVLGTLLVVAGAAASSSLGPHKDQTETLEWLEGIFYSFRFLIYMAILSTGLIVGFVTMRKRPKGRGGKARGIALGLTAGGIAGQMFFMSSALGLVRSCIQLGDWSAWENPLPYMVVLAGVGCAVANVPFMATGLEEYEALFMVTLFEGCHIAVACISGAVVLREMEGTDMGRVIAYWFCVASIIVGLLVIQSTSVRSLDKPIHQTSQQSSSNLKDEVDWGRTESTRNSRNSHSRTSITTSLPPTASANGASMGEVTDALEAGDAANDSDSEEQQALTRDRSIVVWAGPASGVGISIMSSLGDFDAPSDPSDSEDSVAGDAEPDDEELKRVEP